MNDAIMTVDVVVLISCFSGMGRWFDLPAAILMEKITSFALCDLLMSK